MRLAKRKTFNQLKTPEGPIPGVLSALDATLSALVPAVALPLLASDTSCLTVDDAFAFVLSADIFGEVMLDLQHSFDALSQL